MFPFVIVSWLTLLAHLQDIVVRPANNAHSDGAHLLNELIPLWFKRESEPLLNTGGGYRTIFAPTLWRVLALPRGLCARGCLAGLGSKHGLAG
jgi:hypothetical protein